jgi:hypothetical protein
MKRPVATVTDPDFIKQEALAQEIRVLLQMADIARNVENLEHLYQPRYWKDAGLASVDSDGWQHQPKRPSLLQRQAYRAGLREYYFGVVDVTLRCRLIALEREFRNLTLLCTIADLARARADLDRVETWAYSELPAAAIGAVILVVGATLFNAVGGVVIAGLSLFTWLYSFASRRRRISRELSAARANVMMWEEALANERDQAEVFSEVEQRAGAPEPAAGANVVSIDIERRSRRA